MTEEILGTVEESTDGVTAEVNTNLDDSQTSEGDDNSTEEESDLGQENVTDDDTSGDDPEALKIPRSRLNKEIQKRKDLEAQIARNSEETAYWKDFNKMATNDPHLNKAFNSLVQDFNDGKLTPQEVKEQTENLESQYKDPRVDQMLANKKVQNFQAMDYEFRQLASKDFEDVKDITLIGGLVQDIIKNEVNQKNPNADFRDYYTPGMIQDYYKKAKETFDDFGKRYVKKYIQGKSDDQTPTNKQTPAPADNVNMGSKSQAEISSMLADKLRQGKT